MANKYMKKRSTFLAMKEMRIKPILRFPLTSVRMAMSKNKQTNKKTKRDWQGCGRKGILILCREKCK
jgi:hypothetical protein